MAPSQENEVRTVTDFALQRLVGGKYVAQCLDGFFVGKNAEATEDGVEALCRIVEQGSLDCTIEVLTYLIKLGADSQSAFVTALKAIVRRECTGADTFPWRQRVGEKTLLLERVLRLEEERFVPLLRNELAAGLAANVLRPGAWENLYEEFAWAGAWETNDPNDPEVRARAFRWSCGLEASRIEKLGQFGLAAALFTIADPQGNHSDRYRSARDHSQAIALDCAVFERYYSAGARRDFRKVVPIRTVEDLMVELFGAEYQSHPTYRASRRSEGRELYTLDDTGALQLMAPEHMRLAVNLLANGRWGDTQRVVHAFMPAVETKAVRTRSIGPLVIPAMYQAMREERWGVAAALGQIAVDSWTRGEHVQSILSLTVEDYVTERFSRRLYDVGCRIARETDVSPEIGSFGEYAYHQPAPPPVPRSLLREKAQLEADRQSSAATLTMSIRQTIDDLLRRVIELGIPLELDIF